MDDIAVTVNGRRQPLLAVAAHTSALDWLREAGLSGGKEGCAEGECGACAMLLATPDERGGTAWTAVNACLVPVAALNGQEIVTAEGLGSPDALHPVQETLAEAGGSQCGYCTPGFVCSMAGEYYRSDRAPAAAGTPLPEHGPNGFDLHALSGNLCRCTGYRPIRDAAYSLGSPPADDELAARRTRPAPVAVPTDLRTGGARFIRPATLVEALGVLGDAPEALLVAGSTDVGVEVNLRGLRPQLVIAIDQLDELRTLAVDDDVVEIGAALTLSEVERRLGGRVPLIAQLVPQFASRLIRNRATFGGNLGTGSPIGDTPPALLALGARLVLASSTGEREVELADYFTGYRQTLRRPDEIIRAVRVPLPLAGISAFHKIAKRRFDDISSVALGFALDVDDGVVISARIGLGGVAATPLRALATEAALVGRPWNLETVRDASKVLAAEGTPISDHRASSEYRSLMLGMGLVKLYRTAPAESREVPA
ncbi:xanthine dehydrogenase small subunit [Agromyces cerinus]|uniref:Xanthine dehydrogenase small subunit n=1 Tax=Agromyces cerinus subsp. cerinus TaxID=232089 RepID=A0A1N6DDF8_9MICO|nr:FAD binding domain-containing protein [Agromyces cerinus]SIN68684.1 xanthine dehydrogenase small subunit [Agromyces cerinus subsp. cerinus]